MSNVSLNEFQPRLAALTEGLSGGALRAQQALVTFLYSASQAQFGFTRGLTEDLAEAFKANQPANPAAGIQTLVARWHARSEQAIGEFRQISDELRNSLYDSVAQPLTKACEATPDAAERITESARPVAPAVPVAKVRA